MKLRGGKLKNRVVFFGLALFTVFTAGVAGYCFIKSFYEYFGTGTGMDMGNYG